MLAQYAQSLKGMEAYCFQAYSDALEVIPTTLAENAGLNPIQILTELRNRHALGDQHAGINVRTVGLLSAVDVLVPNAALSGSHIEHIGGGRCSTIVGINQRTGIGNRDGLSTAEDRRLRTSKVTNTVE